MHGYMMPGGAPKNNSPIVITWLHYAPSPDADLPAKPSNSRLSSISHQEIGAELPFSWRRKSVQRDTLCGDIGLGIVCGRIDACPSQLRMTAMSTPAAIPALTRRGWLACRAIRATADSRVSTVLPRFPGVRYI